MRPSRRSLIASALAAAAIKPAYAWTHGTPSASINAPTLRSISDPATTTQQVNLIFDATASAGNTVTIQYGTDPAFGSFSTATGTLSSGDIAVRNKTLTLPSQADGTYYARAQLNSSAWSNTPTFQIVTQGEFISSTEGFSAGTQVSAEGFTFTNGYLDLGAGQTATVTFGPFTSGINAVQISTWAFDTNTVGDNSMDYTMLFEPTLGGSGSGNSTTAINVQRFTGSGATSTLFAVNFRKASGFTPFTPALFPRLARYVYLIVIDSNAKTYRIYLNGVRWVNDTPWTNSSAADFAKLTIITQSACPTTHFDTFRVFPNWTPPARSLIFQDNFKLRSGQALSATMADIDLRGHYPQPYISPDAPAFGTWQRTASGLVAPSGKATLGLFRALADECLVEHDWVASATGVQFMGQYGRVYNGVNSPDGGYLVLAYDGSQAAGSKLILKQGSNVLATGPGTLGGVTYPAGATHTFGIEPIGIYVNCYVDGQLQLGPIQAGTRGLLSEENYGPYIDTTVGAVDNMPTAVRAYGAIPSQEYFATVGGYSFVVADGSVREMYDSTL